MDFYTYLQKWCKLEYFYKGKKGMYCTVCGAENQQDARFCVSCGNPLFVESGNNINNGTVVLNQGNETPVQSQAYITNNVQPSTYQAEYNAYVQSQNMYSESLTKEEFFNRFLSSNTKSWIKAVWIICFITAGLNVVLLCMGNIISLVDIVFYIVMGILFKKKNDWRLSLIITCYSGLWSLVGLATTGTPSGIVALVGGVMSTKGLKKADKAYEEYKTTGILPTELF